MIACLRSFKAVSSLSSFPLDAANSDVTEGAIGWTTYSATALALPLRAKRMPTPSQLVQGGDVARNHDIEAIKLPDVRASGVPDSSRHSFYCEPGAV